MPVQPRAPLPAFTVRLMIGGILETVLFTLIGCAAPLLTDISQTQDAIRTAQEAKAEQYASDLLVEAKSGLNEAIVLGAGQRREAKELLLRARLQAELAAKLAGERAIAEQLQTSREQLEAAKRAVDAAKRAAQAAQAELATPAIPP